MSKTGKIGNYGMTHAQSKVIKRSLHLTLLLLMLGIALSILMSSAQSQTLPENGCDPKYYEALESRAWLEAQREITQNQNLIFKPDSVLEYTCFDKFVGELPTNAIFSGSDRWGSGLGADSMAKALDTMVISPLNTYITSNYEYSASDGLLGGRLPGTDHTPVTTVAGGTSYTCDIMNKVWNQAKCKNFIDNEDYDGFYSFENYQKGLEDGKDRRFLPVQCPVSEDYKKTYKENLEKASADTKDGLDPIVMLYDEVDFSKCEDSLTFTTGIHITRKDEAGVDIPRDYDETICLMPGCVFKPLKNKQTQAQTNKARAAAIRYNEYLKRNGRESETIAVPKSTSNQGFCVSTESLTK